jgi:anti-sigma28 factor (negative regulator of flagellin synthesis)
MRKLTMGLAFGAAMMFSVGGAWAYTCPLLVKQLDEQLPKVKDTKKRAQAEKLTKECETLHKEGKHAESVDKCMEAAKVAGIKLAMSEGAMKTYEAMHKK